MTVLVDEVIGRRGDGVFERFDGAPAPRIRRSGRRARALRRPAHGVRILPGVRRRARACMVERRMSPGSLVVVGLAVFAVVAFSGTVLAQMADGMAPAVPAKTAVVSVGASESVWDVARQYAPGSDPRAVVDRIVELNDLHGGAVPAGASLVVPVGR